MKRVCRGAWVAALLMSSARLQVYGWPDMKAVKVSVNTSKPRVFGFEPLFGDGNISMAFKD
ncbi:MAG: hypothetical protein SH820_12735 [Xanthomonadales bacterium]|nr:hypothetical protein [Xanthomonadales bacterium]